MPRDRSRLIGFLLLIVSVVVFVPSVLSIAGRLEARTVPLVWFLDPILSNDFAYRGNPLHVEELLLEGVSSEEPVPALDVTYRGKTTRIPVEARDERLPDLLKYENWMEILPMVEGKDARSADEIEQMLSSGEVEPRLIIATRQTPDDYDPGSWGLVRRKDWNYTFYEFLHDAPAEESVRIRQDTYRNLEQLVDADIREELGREDDLWMYHAMIQVTPANYYPKNKQVDESISAMGWAWPAAGLTVLGMLVGIMLIMMSRVSPTAASL